MTAKNFSLLAAVIFAIVAILQLARALSGAPITIGATFSVPVWASWIACIIAAALAWIGFSASRRDDRRSSPLVTLLNRNPMPHLPEGT